MSLLDRTTSVREESAAPAEQPQLLNGGRYVTTRSPHALTEGTYVSTGSRATVQGRGSYVTTSAHSAGNRREGRYTDRG